MIFGKIILQELLNSNQWKGVMRDDETRYLTRLIGAVLFLRQAPVIAGTFQSGAVATGH